MAVCALLASARARGREAREARSQREKTRKAALAHRNAQAMARPRRAPLRSAWRPSGPSRPPARGTHRCKICKECDQNGHAEWDGAAERALAAARARPRPEGGLMKDENLQDGDIQRLLNELCTAPPLLGVAAPHCPPRPAAAHFRPSGLPDSPPQPPPYQAGDSDLSSDIFPHF